LAGAWLLKSSLSEWLQRETEAFKTRLKTDADIAIEKLKSSLQIAATEHQVMFSKMHEKRAEVIEAVYTKLTDLHSSAEVFVVTSENNPDSERHTEAFATLRSQLIEYFTFVQQHRIFLPAEVCDLLDRPMSQIRKAVHWAGNFGGKEHIVPAISEKSFEALNKAYQAFNVDIPAAQKVLEDEFRRMLGVA